MTQEKENYDTQNIVPLSSDEIQSILKSQSEIVFEVNTATDILDSQNRVNSKQFKGSEIFSEDKYNNYTQIKFLTSGI